MFSNATNYNKISKAIIPVAGLGTRMLPASKAIPKEMLPIVDRPLIQYIVEECAQAGITEIILVTHSSKNAIENHFDTNFELESMLAKHNKIALLQKIATICPPSISISTVRQGQAQGLGHAVLCARPLVGNCPFAVILPDVIINKYQCNMEKDNLAGMIMRYQSNKHSQVMVEPVAKEKVSSYGIVDCKGVPFIAGNSIGLFGVVEKPAPDKAPSNYAIVGRYVFSEKIWDLLTETKPGAGGEIQLTDAIGALITYEPVEAYCIIGKSHDCGDKIGYIHTFTEYAKHRYPNALAL